MKYHPDQNAGDQDAEKRFKEISVAYSVIGDPEKRKKYDQIGQENNLHNDASLVTLNIKLNNDYQGCELLFPRQQFNSKDVPTGYAMIWPSVVSHPHVTTPLTLGRKLSIVSWTWPPEWSKTGIPNIKNLNAFE
jgi:curved DNA-binding protein CbpA